MLNQSFKLTYTILIILGIVPYNNIMDMCYSNKENGGEMEGKWRGNGGEMEGKFLQPHVIIRL